MRPTSSFHSPLQLCYYAIAEFNNNSTPLQKVQLFYSTIWNDGFKKRSNTNTLRDIVSR